jgi:sugar phosphate permease
VQCACAQARNNSAVAKSALGDDLGFAQSTLGNMDASFLTAYTLGSFALGPLTDAVGAWPCLVVGLAGVGAVQAGLAWGGASSAPSLAALYALNGLLQSALYPACKKVMAEHFGEKSRGAALGQWSTCYYLGSIASTTLATQLLSGGAGADVAAAGGWRIVFAAPALLLPLIAAALLPVAAALPPSPTHVDEPAPSAAAIAPSADADAAAASTAPSAPASSLFDAYPAPIWVCSLSYAVIKCTRYAFLLWLPLYLINDANLSLAAAGATAALFDVGSIGACVLPQRVGVCVLCCVGAMRLRWACVRAPLTRIARAPCASVAVGSLVAGSLSDRLGQQAGLASAMLAPLAALLFAFPAVATGPISSIPGALPATVLALGVLIGGPETLQGSVAPLRYAAPAKRASAVGFVNGWGSAGTVLAAPLIPAVAARVGGMEHAFALLGPLAAMAGAVTFLQWVRARACCLALVLCMRVVRASALTRARCSVAHRRCMMPRRMPSSRCREHAAARGLVRAPVLSALAMRRQRGARV